MIEKLLAVQRQYLGADNITIYFIGGGGAGKYFNILGNERDSNIQIASLLQSIMQSLHAFFLSFFTS